MKDLTDIAKRLRFGSVVGTVAVVAGVSLSSCGGDDEPTGSAGPAGPAAISITSPTPGEVITLGGLPRAGVAVRIQLENWTLRPPGGCGGTEQCGYVVLTVDDGAVPEVSAITTLLVIELDSLADPTGQRTFEVELRNDDGTVFVGEDGLPVTASVQATVELGPTDGGLGDAQTDGGGLDAADDAPVDALPDSPLDGPMDGADDGAQDVAVDAVVDASDAGDDDGGVSDAAADGNDAAPDSGDASDSGGASDAASDAPADQSLD